jgi:ABC-type microcin C transport system duplicated ATPase subunit YejF
MAVMSSRDEPVLEIANLDVRFDTPDGEVHAVRGAGLTVGAGETLAIVGESGSGKSQLMLAALGLLTANGRASGSVSYRGTELLGLPPRALNRYRGAKVSMIFQEPMTSLDPHYRIGRQIAEPLVYHRGLTRRAARPRVLELLQLVGIADAEARLGAYPHELSGGQRQRVMIAMALANEPDLLIADEPTTALDVTIQAQILALLASLQARLGMAVVFITHDLNIVRHIAERVVVMHDGEIVEQGPTGRIFAAPREDYTKMLLAAERRQSAGAGGPAGDAGRPRPAGELRRPGRPLRPAPGRPHRGRRRHPAATPGPNPRRRRRVRLRQDDPRPRAPAALAERGRNPLCRRRYSRPICQ